MLHILLHEHHKMPDEIYNKPRGVKNFIYASILLDMDEKEKQKNKPKMAR